MIDGEHLFDPGQYPQVPRKAVPGESELAAAVALDRKPQLIHEGGELWTRRVAVHSADKAYYAHYYADIVGTGMRTAYPGPRAWVELFAGPGRLFVEGEDRHRPGSPVEALDIRDRFDIYFFADLDERCTRSLHARLGQEPNVHVHRGDANAADLHDKFPATRLWSSTPTRRVSTFTSTPSVSSPSATSTWTCS